MISEETKAFLHGVFLGILVGMAGSGLLAISLAVAFDIVRG